MKGRPYGRTGFICRKSNGLSYCVIECDSDRLCAIKILRHPKVILNIIGVYLPYDTSGSEQMDCYINTLDILQNIVDECDKNCPIVIVGDMNTSLPKQSTLSKIV